MVECKIAKWKRGVFIEGFLGEMRFQTWVRGLNSYLGCLG